MYNSPVTVQEPEVQLARDKWVLSLCLKHQEEEEDNTEGLGFWSSRRTRRRRTRLTICISTS